MSYSNKPLVPMKMADEVTSNQLLSFSEGFPDHEFMSRYEPNPVMDHPPALALNKDDATAAIALQAAQGQTAAGEEELENQSMETTSTRKRERQIKSEPPDVEVS